MVCSREADEKDMQNTLSLWAHKRKNYRKTEKLILMGTPFLLTKTWGFPGKLKSKEEKFSMNFPMETFLFSCNLLSSIMCRCFLFPCFLQVSSSRWLWGELPLRRQNDLSELLFFHIHPTLHLESSSKISSTLQIILLALKTTFISTSNFSLTTYG